MWLWKQLWSQSSGPPAPFRPLPGRWGQEKGWRLRKVSGARVPAGGAHTFWSWEGGRGAGHRLTLQRNRAPYPHPPPQEVVSCWSHVVGVQSPEPTSQLQATGAPRRAGFPPREPQAGPVLLFSVAGPGGIHVARLRGLPEGHSVFIDERGVPRMPGSHCSSLANWLCEWGMSPATTSGFLWGLNEMEP